MKEAFWGYFLIVLGMFVIVVLLLVQRLTTTNEEDFYLTREVLEASMIDAVDYGSYRLTGRIVMSAEKFEEVFIRRFAESVTNNKSYTIDFYDIYEDPPKATVRIKTSSGTATINSDTFGISVDTILSGILETLEGSTGESVIISGKNKIGEKLQAIFKNNKFNGTVTYKWYTNTENSTTGGTEIYGATGNSITLTSQELDKYIYVVASLSVQNQKNKTYSDITDSITNGWGKVAKKEAVKEGDTPLDVDLTNNNEKFLIDEECYNKNGSIKNDDWCKELEKYANEYNANLDKSNADKNEINGATINVN